jgi:hypothetical protein
MHYKGSFIALILSLLTFKNVYSQEKIENEQRLEAFKLAYNAYLWGYPLVAQGVQAVTDLSGVNPKYKINNFTVVSNLFPIETGPKMGNIDGIYAKAYLDLKQGGVLVTLPIKSTQYYSLMFVDAFSNNFANISSLKNPAKDPLVFVVGPEWKGVVPKNVKQILKSPTNFAWIIARTSILEKIDLEESKKILESIKLDLVSSDDSKKNWLERTQFPALKPNLSVNDQINLMDYKSYFLWVSKMMRENPIYERQKEYVTGFLPLGLTSTKDFDGKEINNRELKGIKQALLDARDLLKSESKSQQDFFKNGWAVNINEGNWGNKYTKNAASAFNGFDQTQPEELIKLKSSTDTQKENLNGGQSYRLLIKKGLQPQTSSFWTVSVYDENNFLVENSVGKYGISNKTKGLKIAKDGSLSILFQENPPQGMEANWIPTPKGNFKVVIKVYSPGEMVRSGEWIPDAIEKFVFVPEPVTPTKPTKTPTKPKAGVKPKPKSPK